MGSDPDMLWWLLANVGWGCCAVDADRDERHAAAAIVAVGVVDHLEARREADGDLMADQVVRVTELERGQLTTEWLRIPSYLAHRDAWRRRGDSGLPFPPGTEVRVVATPEPGGFVSYSVCAPDVFELPGPSDPIPWGPGALAEGAQPAEPWVRPAEGEPTGDRVMVGLSNGTTAEADVLGKPLEGGQVTLRVDVRGVAVVDVVPLDTLLRVLAEPLPLGPGAELFARPGLLVRDGVVEVDEQAHAVPDELVGVSWSEERAANDPSGEPVYLTCADDIPVHAVAGGPPVLSLYSEPERVWATGAKQGDWVQIEVSTDEVVGRGWVREEWLLPEGSLCLMGIGTSSHHRGPVWRSARRWVEPDGRVVQLDAPAQVMLLSTPTRWRPDVERWAVIDAPTTPRIVRLLD